MQRKSFRIILGIMLVISAAFAAWSWFRPFEWRADAAARGSVVGVQVTRDHSNYWLEAHVRMDPGEGHDLRKPVRLLTSAGRELEPADTTLSGSAEQPISELWFRFWLEDAEFSGPLELRLNDGKLLIRNGRGLPRLGGSGRKVFTTSRW